jgi:ISXO2-like transposase domain
MDIFRFMTQFDTVEKVRRFLLEEHIIYDEIICNCGGHMKIVHNANKYGFRCTKNTCRKRKSCYYGTIFNNASLPFPKIMAILFFWVNKVEVMKIVSITGISHKMVMTYIKKIESIICGSLDEEDSVIGGPDIEVQIDESKFGKRKYNRGRYIKGVWVLGGVEITQERKIFLKIVENRNAETLEDMIYTYAKPGSVIVTDGWAGYLGISALGYRHKIVNHSETFVNEEGFHTNNIEGTWNSIKSGISSRNRTTNSMRGKLFEYIWRRKNEGNIWNALIEAMRIGHVD